MSNQDVLLALSKEVNESFALRIEGRLETLRINFFVFGRNYWELKQFIEDLNKGDNWLKLWDMRNRDQLDIVRDETVRLLQNFLASARALVAQTNVVISHWYKDQKFLAEYKSQVAQRFTGDSLVGFIEELRNFSLHYALPLTTATLAVQIEQNTGNSIANFGVVMPADDLLFWSGWTHKGKRYLSAAGEQIDIGRLADEYYAKIEPFHQWVVNRLTEIHASELAWLAEMKKSIINAMDDEEREARGLSKQ